MTWRDYHESTKHTPEALRRSRHFLDWETMPAPFRSYAGAPVIPLAAQPAQPPVAALDVLRGEGGEGLFTHGAAFLSQLLFHCAAVSATKRVPSTGYTYALRVNPSSGNLHPTEFHFLTRGLEGWEDGLYHYRAAEHAAERRARGGIVLPGESGTAPVVFVLASIAWREAWKYRSRAYRYCLHDMGHAWEALAQAARALGCETRATGGFDDDAIAAACALPDDEWPLLLVELVGAVLPRRAPDAGALDGSAEWSAGHPNVLSREEVEYPLIREIHAATRRNGGGAKAVELPAEDRGGTPLPEAARVPRGFGETVRRRRSALDFEGGSRGMTAAQLRTLLDAAALPMQADFAARFVRLYLYAHRVEGLPPGVYRCRPEQGAVELLRAGDQRVAAAGLSLGQDLAGNACVAFSMIADLERAGGAHGDRGYRYAHFEAGAIGQRLYVGAEAMGLRATGIGAFYDDAVHSYLGLSRGEGSVIYHFAVGHAVPDPRLEG